MSHAPPQSPAIVARRQTRLSAWFTVVEKDVSFPWIDGVETYHALLPLPYVAIVALTPGGRLPILRQWRPAVEAYTLELPAGLIDEGEFPEDTCKRELKEETGLVVRSLQDLGGFALDTGRVEGVQHVFLAHCDEPPTDFTPEPGTTVTYHSVTEVIAGITSGTLTSLLHIGAFYLAHLRITPIDGS